MSGDVLTYLYNACDPMKPASPEFYVDCSDVRGSHAFTRQFCNDLARTTDGFLCFLFSGHIGSGKSSELEHLRYTLEHCEPNTDKKRFFPVFLNAGDYLDDYDVTPTDILLAILTELADALRERADIDLKDSYLTLKMKEVTSLLTSTFQISKKELNLAFFKSEIQLLKKDPGSRQRVRDAIQPQMTSLIAEINLLFEAARLRLRKKRVPPEETPYTDIVLILDNLEKIQRLSGHEEGIASQRELFIDRSPQLKGLGVHTVFTIPLSLVRSEASRLESSYGRPPFVLPMIKVEERGDHTLYIAGREKLRELVQKRLVDVSVDEVFERDALDWLINYSGGDVRRLMGFIRQAISDSKDPPIGLATAKRALSPTISAISPSISFSQWSRLAQLERNQQQQIDPDDADYQELLTQVHIMEYLNGGDDDPFNEAAPWYAVNPILRELRQFKAVLYEYDKMAAEGRLILQTSTPLPELRER